MDKTGKVIWNKEKTKLISFIFLAIAIAVSVCGFKAQVLAEQEAPNFCLKDIKGKDVCLKDFSGKVIVLEFWATWCLPCRVHIPELNRLQERYRKQGLVVIGICIEDTEALPDEDLKIYSKSKGIKFTILRANQNLIKTYFTENKLTIPTFIVIKRNGQVEKKITGNLPEKFEATLTVLLEKK